MQMPAMRHPISAAKKASIKLVQALLALGVGFTGISATAASKQVSCTDPKLDSLLADFKESKGRRLSQNSSDGYKVDHRTASLSVGGKQKSINFDFFHAQLAPAKGTVFFFCGGPGYACTKDGRPHSIPSDMNVVTFDYLGLGANAAKVSTSEMSIEAQADVAIGLIKELKVKDYVLYGQSFGTTVATVAAARLSNKVTELSADKVPNKPKMIILDGVVGTASKLDRALATKKAADRAWQLLNKTEQARFQKAYERESRGLGTREKTELNDSLTSLVESGPLKAADGLRDFSRPLKLSDVNPTDKDETHTSDGMGPRQAHEYRAAGCQVDSQPHTKSAGDLFGGLVHASAPNEPGELWLCSCPLLKNTYDSKTHQIKDVPIVYINSETDVQTPIVSAKYHFESQLASNTKIFITPKDGGHGELEGMLLGCGEKFWHAAIAADVAGLKAQGAQMNAVACNEVLGKKSNVKSVAAIK
jgi:pimeloyl-ACP methyl ester carboxylesterase